jgi:hypothetical protein
MWEIDRQSQAALASAPGHRTKRAAANMAAAASVRLRPAFVLTEAEGRPKAPPSAEPKEPKLRELIGNFCERARIIFASALEKKYENFTRNLEIKSQAWL